MQYVHFQEVLDPCLIVLAFPRWYTLSIQMQRIGVILRLLKAHLED